jgi:hypothetical protein
MGYLESAVVVYLRELYYPDGFVFPLKAMSQNVAITELYREAATLIMILAVSVLAAENRLHRFAWFLLVFGTWDIAYYVFLKLLIGWPGSFLTTDILFLLPSIWTGPVIAPLINSCTMILFAMGILRSKNASKQLMHLSRFTWILLIAGSLVVLMAYMKDFASYVMDYRHSILPVGSSANQNLLTLSTQFVPRSFDWMIFSAGVCMHLIALILMLFEKRKASDVV